MQSKNYVLVSLLAFCFILISSLERSNDINVKSKKYSDQLQNLLNNMP